MDNTEKDVMPSSVPVSPPETPKGDPPAAPSSKETERPVAAGVAKEGSQDDSKEAFIVPQNDISRIS